MRWMSTVARVEIALLVAGHQHLEVAIRESLYHYQTVRAIHSPEQAAWTLFPSNDR